MGCIILLFSIFLGFSLRQFDGFSFRQDSLIRLNSLGVGKAIEEGEGEREDLGNDEKISPLEVLEGLINSSKSRYTEMQQAIDVFW